LIVPSKPQGDLVREQGEEIKKLVERLDHFKRDLDRFETNFAEDRKTAQEFHTRLAVTVKDVERLEKRLDEFHSRRWETWKIILTLVLGAILSNGVSIVAKMVERNAQVDPIREKR
jgi:hypothetical protein